MAGRKMRLNNAFEPAKALRPGRDFQKRAVRAIERPADAQTEESGIYLDVDKRDLLIFTVGHSTRPIEEFVRLLRGHQVTKLVDVRTMPRSRTNPQFNRDVLPESLRPAGIGYVHVPELGGLRKSKKESINAGWRNASFRGYADYMQTAEFKRALATLIQWAPNDRLALMCAEAVPWRCHRSLIADALTVRGIRVEEITSPTRTQAHKLTRFAKVEGTKVTYPEEIIPAGQQPMTL